MRDGLDRYYTPAWPTEALLETFSPVRTRLTTPKRILDPCAGQGGIASVLREHGHHVITGDIDPEAPTDHHWDFAQARLHPERYLSRCGGKVDWIITNPPYCLAEAMVRAALAVSADVAMLLRVTWLEPCVSRFDLLDELAYVLTMPRISFTGDGSTDSAAGAWFVWLSKARESDFKPARLLILPPSTRPPRTERQHRPLGREQDPIQGSLLGGGHG